MNKRTLIHAVVDTAAIFAFVAVGKLSHAEPLHLSELFAVASPFILAWAMVSIVIRWLWVARADNWFSIIGIVSARWMLSVPLALVLREVVNGKPILLAFAITTTLFGMLFLLGGRLSVRAISVRRAKKTANK
jgi:hypothetical protein